MHAEPTASTSELFERAELLAIWISQLRRGNAVPEIRLRGTDPMARLGNELQLLAETMSRQEEKLGRLFELVEVVEKGVLLPDVLDRVFESFRGLIPFERIGCAFLSEDGTRLSAHWARSELGPVQISGGYSQPMAGSSLLRILDTGEPRIINDLEAYLAAKPDSASTQSIVREGGRSSLTCPLVVDGRPLGFLFFTSCEKFAYGPQHQETFRRIAAQVSIVIDKSRAYQQIVDRNRELVEEGRRLEERANRDALTGVLNRGAIMRIADKTLRESRSAGVSVGVILADIDHFKQINDTFGHAAGDLVLKGFTQRLMTVLGHEQQLGRYGGEEFLIVVPTTSADQLVYLAERLRDAVAAAAFQLGAEERFVSASFGAAVSTESDAPIAELVAAADCALYRAKNGGRNRVVLNRATLECAA